METLPEVYGLLTAVDSYVFDERTGF